MEKGFQRPLSHPLGLPAIPSREEHSAGQTSGVPTETTPDLPRASHRKARKLSGQVGTLDMDPGGVSWAHDGCCE